MRTVLALLLTTGFASAQTIELAPPAIGTSPRPAARVRVAGTATESLAVWQDFDSLRAVRVDLLGRPLDERGIEIATGDVVSAEVATDGRDYLIAYSICVSRDTDCSTNFATISPDGTVFRSRQRLLGAIVESLAWTGDRHVIAYHDDVRLPAAASLAILDRRGFVLEDRIHPTSEDVYYVDLAGDGAGGIALVWAGPRGSGFASGPLDAMRRGALVPVRLTGTFYPLTVAAASDGFVVGGEDLMHLWRTLLISRSGVITKTSTSTYRYASFAVGATSTTRFAIFSEPVSRLYQQSLRMQPVDRSAPALSVMPDVTTWHGYGVDIAATSDGGAVVGWTQQLRDWTTEVHVVRVTPDGTLLRGPAAHRQPVNRGFVEYDTPVVRRCGDTFLTAWVEDSDRQSVRYRRVSASGAPLDPPSRRVTSPTPNDQYWPTIACTGESMLLTWVERESRMVDERATIARGMLFANGSERLIELGPAKEVYAAGIAGEYVVVRAGNDEWHEASHWRADGTQRTGWTQLFHQPSCNPGRGAIESNGEELMIANVNHCPAQGRQYVIARPFSRDLMSLRTPVTFQVDSAGDAPAIAAAPDGWLVVWGSGATFFGRIDRLFLGLDSRRGVYAGLGGPASAVWNGCAFEIFGRDAVSRVSMTGDPTRVPTTPADARVASDGPGLRLAVTTERAEDGSMRVVGRFELSPGCVR